MNRRNLILAGVLVLQLIVVAVVLWPRPAASESAGQALFPELQADQIVGLTITDSANNTLRLAKREGAWVLPDADDYPCQDDRVSPFLAKIVEINTDRLVAQTSSSHARLKVSEDDFERRVVIDLAEGGSYQLYLGTSPSYQVTHVRAGGQSQVYLNSGLSAQDASVQATAWVDRTYLTVDRDQVIAFSLENANGFFEFEKGGDEWTMKGLAADETPSSTSIQTLLNQATLVSMTEPLGREEQDIYGLRQPSAVVTLHTGSEEEGDKTVTLRVGRKDTAENSYVISTSESPYYVRVSEFTGDNFAEKSRDDFLELPPTPTTTPESGPSG